VKRPGLTAAVKVRLEPRLLAELERRARATELPASALARRLIREGLAALREADGR
jgi:hypothetical protein